MLPQEEPVIIEIPDDDDAPMPTPTVVEQDDSTSEDIGSTSTSAAINSSTIQDENATYESIGNESDLQILVPQISIIDVEAFEEKPIDLLEDPVKIKEEPKDDGYDEDDGFEDVGTFEEAALIEDNSGKCLFF